MWYNLICDISGEGPLLKPRVRWYHIQLKQARTIIFLKSFTLYHVELGMAGAGPVISSLAKYEIIFIA